MRYPILLVVISLLAPIAAAEEEYVFTKAEQKTIENVTKYLNEARAEGTALQRTKFCSAAMTDESMAIVVSGYPNLEFLHASHTASLSPRGVRLACQAKQVQSLQLAGDRITDESLRPLLQLKHLEKLYLRGHLISDQSLVLLAKIPTLKFLRIDSPNVTPAGIKQFQRLRPGCEIIHKIPTAR